ncbi:MAG: glycolate oxidase subunit GlcE [Granulosicoccus sp.]|nr:glycolate oxidase subunit GlcE [Granulosicoccus sp.]
MNDSDESAGLIDTVRQAASSAVVLRITGGDSKKRLGNRISADATDQAFSTLSHTGIISYEPTELVVSVRAGTPLQRLNQVLDDAGQMLAFEPPEFPGSTIGGVLACGMSGPRRPFNGSARDYVLGTRIINGQGQDLSFGGEVMKNVAGYDVSRLQVGAWGTLGVLLDVSMKVLPRPEAEMTLVQDANAEDTQSFISLLRQPWPLSGAMLLDNRRYLRLSGSEASVRAAARELGGEAPDTEDAGIWQSVRDQSHHYFLDRSEGQTLWRISVADHAPELALQGEWLHEWAGAQRWVKTRQSADEVFQAARSAGGHAIRYDEGPAGEPAFQPLEGAMLRLQSRIRDSFDRERLFNRGRFHPELDAGQSYPTAGST